eukprot:TRINITY_DN16646_c0_g1_i1.p1 TRINITY_DN16646_c0_g1~~TRINITY_DN16646_c0_g1_i1.p1  ORF type:complete len:336 (+),score=41.35 TRINITY_DN16646_c0_g1_i1:40-1008(+)
MRQAKVIALFSVAMVMQLMGSMYWWNVRGGRKGMSKQSGIQTQRPEDSWKQLQPHVMKVSIPSWVMGVRDDKNGEIIVHEVFDSERSEIKWSRDRSVDIPVNRPAGWTPVSPLTFDCPLLHWYNKPDNVRYHPVYNNLLIKASQGTDFWQAAGDSAERGSCDDGHFLHLEVPQNPGECIIATTRVGLLAKSNGDKAGIMIRRGRGSWVGAYLGKEPETPHLQLGTIVTNNAYSDYSPSVCDNCREASFRFSVDGDNVLVEANLTPDEDPSHWSTLRIATLYDEGEEIGKNSISVGVFAAAPSSEGMEAAIGYLSISVRPRGA